MSYITALGTANPSYRIDQATICSFMEKTMNLDSSGLGKLRAIFKASGIDYRYSVLDDYSKQNNFSFYTQHEEGIYPSTQSRLAVFRNHALPLSVAAANNLFEQIPSFDKNEITHLIVVCCTGMYAPGLDIELVKTLQLKLTVERTCITFMGCYAAFNAMKVAHAFCKADEHAKVLIVCTELCSLHFQHALSDDNLLANTLFADGSAAVLMEAKTNKTKRLSLEKFHSNLAFEGEQDMAWTIGDAGFEMKLTAYIPSIIKGGIEALTHALLQKMDKHMEDIKYFAIHPGGIKILEAIEHALGITKEDNTPAYSVLRNFGNMSSPTVVFVLNELFKKIKQQDNNEYILSLAFGPGLTLESMMLKIEME